jgi:hypothetical protein
MPYSFRITRWDIIMRRFRFMACWLRRIGRSNEGVEKLTGTVGTGMFADDFVE